MNPALLEAPPATFWQSPEAYPAHPYSPERTHGLSFRQVRELLTDASEQLSYMQNTFPYWLTPDCRDLQADTGERLGELLDKGVLEADRQAARDPRWRIEAHRRRLERWQHDQTVQFARQTEGPVTVTSLSLDGRNNERKNFYGDKGVRAVLDVLNPHIDQRSLRLKGLANYLDPSKVLEQSFAYKGALCFVSMPPACVRKTGQRLAGAYNPDRLTTLVRIVCPAGQSPEDVARSIRQVYDRELRRLYGGQWHGGQRISALGRGHIMDYILCQTDLVDAHLRRVATALQQGAAWEFRGSALEDLRYDLVAALNARLGGQMVTSLARAGVEARRQGKQFGGSCPTDLEEQAEALGLHRVQKNCPFCGSCNIIYARPQDPACSDKTCASCFASVVGGLVFPGRVRKK